MLTYLDISLFESPAQTLVNTVNTVGVMGKGIAAEFKKRYPDMYKEYRRLCDAKKLDTGKLYIYRTPNKIIVNFPTKKHWRQRSRIEYIEAGLQKFVDHYIDYGISSVSFPQLGCGHGELNWEKQVQPVMERYLQHLPIPVYIHLYSKSAEFVPERIDKDYATQLRLERERIAIDKLWNDLKQQVLPSGISLSLFGPYVEMTEEHLIFKPTPGDPVIIYREDIQELWNILRLRGTLRESDFPQEILEEGASQWIFELLQRLQYIRPLTLRSRSEGNLIREAGLQYVAPSQNEVIANGKIVV